MAISETEFPNSADAQLRFAREAVPGQPANPTAFKFEPVIDSSDVQAESTSVEITGISGGHKQKPLPGKSPVAGTVSAQNDVNGMLPAWMSALRKASSTVDNGDGSFETRYSPSQSLPVGTWTLEQNQGDGQPDLFVGQCALSATSTVANNAAMITSGNWIGGYHSVWKTAAKVHPNPSTGGAYLRGLPERWHDRPASDPAGAVSLMLVDLFLGLDGTERAIFLSRSGQTTAITGTWTVGAGTNIFTGVGGLAKTEVFGRLTEPDGSVIAGDVINVEGVFLEVDKVTSDNAFTTFADHTAGAAAATLTRAYGAPGVAGAGKMEFGEITPGLSTEDNAPRYGDLRRSAGGAMGNIASASDTTQLYLENTTGIVAGTLAPITATVTVGAGSATISGGLLLADLSVGDFVITPLTPEGKRIIRIDASGTTAEADSKYAASEVAAIMSSRPRPSIAQGADISVAAASPTITGVGTSFLTTLSVGSTFRTAGGQERVIVDVASDLIATAAYDFDGTEANVAGTSPYEWVVDRHRDQWVHVSHPSGPLPELGTQIKLKISGSALPEEFIGRAQSLAVTFGEGLAVASGIGGRHSRGVKPGGLTTGTIGFTTDKSSINLKQTTLLHGDLRFDFTCSSNRTIPGSTRLYSWRFIVHMTAEGKPTVIPNATDNTETVTGPLVEAPFDPDGFVDPCTLIVVSDDSNPLATS